MYSWRWDQCASLVNSNQEALTERVCVNGNFLYKDSSTEPLEQNISRVLLYELSGCVQELLREKVLEFEFVL